jgi:hypothetical protein
MVTFDQFVRRFGGLKKHIISSTKKMLKEAGIVQMIVDQQHEGIGSDGSKMQSGYSTGYAKRRKKKSLQTSFVDLHFTGKMHKGMKVIPVKDGVDIRSKEPYEYYVRANFPKGFSLTQEHANEVGNIVANHLAVEMKKFLVA